MTFTPYKTFIKLVINAKKLQTNVSISGIIFHYPMAKDTHEASMNTEIILEENFEQYRVITLNRPERLNALSLDLARALARACQNASKEEKLRAVIIRGAQGNFSAGGDLKNFHQNIDSAQEGFFQVSEALNQAIEAISSMPKPVIAAIEGNAYAAAFGVAISCDILVASEDARLSPSFTNIALSPNASTTHFLPRIIGPKKAAEAFFTAQSYSAQEAQELGIVNHVWKKSEFESQLQSLVEKLIQRPTATIGRIKKLLRSSCENDLTAQLELEKREISASSMSLDFKEGVTAFVEKRRPKFKGH